MFSFQAIHNVDTSYFALLIWIAKIQLFSKPTKQIAYSTRYQYNSHSRPRWDGCNSVKGWLNMMMCEKISS